MDYYYLLNRIKKGPVSLEELKGLKLEKNTLVWREGLTDWTNANKLDELKELFKVSPPPVPPPPVPPPPVQSPKIASPPPMPSISTKEDVKKTIERTGRSEEEKKLTYEEIADKVLPVKKEQKTTEIPPPFNKKTSKTTTFKNNPKYKSIRVTNIVLLVVLILTDTIAQLVDGRTTINIAPVIITYLISLYIVRKMFSKNQDFKYKIIKTIGVWFGVLIANFILITAFLMLILN